ncbi:MAG: RsmB/NOP family class I SAM-dependent RNA methyltransferase [Patescibacteria group bacterium]|nr:RsmB/NOP family class I SAM-dependent RNA methyltransferase [Patescibacteria group bacterium]
MGLRQADDTSLFDSLRANLLKTYQESDVDIIFHGFSCRRHTTLRVNTLKITREEFENLAKNHHVVLTHVSWYQDAYILISPSLQEFSKTPLYTNGFCYVQSLSSMLPSLILSPEKGDRVLDLCAAPGSKTSHIAALMQNTGEIIANDASHTRIYRLKANLKKLGVTNTTVIRSVGQGLWLEYPKYFDKTLVDVPCSMEGRICIHDPKTYQDWSTRKIKELQEKQKFLLRSGVSATKPGGIIVYSTCTLSKKENEDVISWILTKEKGNVILEDFSIDGVPFVEGIGLKETKKIFPSEMFEGFFIAKLRKKPCV